MDNNRKSTHRMFQKADGDRTKYFNVEDTPKYKIINKGQ